MKKSLFSLTVSLMVSSTLVFSQTKKTVPTVSVPVNKFVTGTEDFTLMTSFIEKHGVAVKERGIKSDHQFVFFDKDKNRYAFITIRRDARSFPSVKAPVSQISVWAYKKGIKDQKHFFGFDIDSRYGQPFMLPTKDGTVDPDFALMKNGYLQFLKKIKG